MRSGVWNQDEEKNKKSILAIHPFQICEMISETSVQKLGRKGLWEKDHFFIFGGKKTFFNGQK